MDSLAAKQFLISRVIEESVVENVPLSEIEKKMLHFTEAHPSLPDIYEVNAEFERDYDNNEYETKVAGLLKNARERDRKGSPDGDRQWQSALDALKKEDHYILVMVNQAFGERFVLNRRQPGSRFLDLHSCRDRRGCAADAGFRMEIRALRALRALIPFHDTHPTALPLRSRSIPVRSKTPSAAKLETRSSSPSPLLLWTARPTRPALSSSRNF